MKIEVDSEGNLVAKEIYSGLTLETEEGNKLAVCMRDDTIEMRVLGIGSETWFRVNMETGNIEKLN